MMDRHFMSIALVGVIVIGVSGIVAGGILSYILNNPMAGSVCFQIGSSALSGMIGFIVAPKIQAPAPPLALQIADAQKQLSDLLTQQATKQ